MLSGYYFKCLTNKVAGIQEETVVNPCCKNSFLISTEVVKVEIISGQYYN